ncbi:MAG: sugar phosphate isomerase/epimerase family protein [Gemmatimonadales bacterium]
MTTRRDFLGAVGAATLGSHRLFSRLAPRASRLGSLGVQLYTVRGLMESDFEGTLRQVARIGYREVEFAGYFNHAPRDIRAMLDRFHLVSPGTHVPIEALDSGFDRMLDDAHMLGQEYVVVAWTPVERRRTLDDWRRIAELYNRAGEQAHAAGLQFAYHNHSYEFVALEGRLPYDVLLEATDPRLVRCEMDLYWITAGGQDPLAYFARYPGRFPLVHVKDMAADKRMVDVGAGVIDWRAIFARREQAGIRHYLVEHDEPADPIASIRASYAYLSRLDV